MTSWRKRNAAAKFVYGGVEAWVGKVVQLWAEGENEPWLGVLSGDGFLREMYLLLSLLKLATLLGFVLLGNRRNVRAIRIVARWFDRCR